MKAISKLLVAGMLAMATAMPAAYACPPGRAHIPVHASARVTITDALAYRILADVAGELEAQLGQSLSTDFLYNAYKNGQAQITYLGYDGIGYVFQVQYSDGQGEVLLQEFG
jgi:hypothetical protein